MSAIIAHRTQHIAAREHGAIVDESSKHGVKHTTPPSCRAAHSSKVRAGAHIRNTNHISMRPIEPTRSSHNTRLHMCTPTLRAFRSLSRHAPTHKTPRSASPRAMALVCAAAMRRRRRRAHHRTRSARHTHRIVIELHATPHFARRTIKVHCAPSNASPLLRFLARR